MNFKIIFSAATVGLALAQAASAMPCDTGYSCVSKSGKYQIELQRCRYVNDLRLESFTFKHVAVTDATLGPSWDGKSVGDTQLSFQVNWPSTGDAVHLISVEVPAKSMKGTVKEKSVDSQPAPFKTLASESITCQISE